MNISAVTTQRPRRSPSPNGRRAAPKYKDAEPSTKHRIVQALLEQIEVLGPNEVCLYPSVEADARGWAAAMSGEFREATLRISDTAIACGFAAVIPEQLDLTVGYGRGESG